MFPKLFFSVLLVSLCMQVSAQVYSGQTTLLLSSEGTQSATSIEGSPLVSSYVANQQLVSMMIKTDAMLLNQPAVAQSVLQDVLQADYNKIFLVQLNVSSLTLSAGTSVTDTTVPLTIRYNNTLYKGEAIASFDVSSEEVTFSFQAQVSLPDLGLKTNPDHAAHFSDQLTVAVEGGTLIFKY